MSFDLQWDHEFCLACDKQTDGATYCSESCRLSDYEKTSTPSSSASQSPSLTGPSVPWTFSNPTTRSTPFYLSPAYDFTHAQPYGSTPLPTRTYIPQQPRAKAASLAPPTRALSPSSSHSSLTSIKSNASTGPNDSQLSEKARKELLAYASSFEQVKLQRRRSY